MMATDQERVELSEAMAEVIGERMGAVLMQHLPPHRWDELATTAGMDQKFSRVDEQFARVDEQFARVDEQFSRVDEQFSRVDGRLRVLEHTLAGLDDRFEATEQRLRAHISTEVRDIAREMNAQTRLLFLSMTGAVFTSASLAFAAVRF